MSVYIDDFSELVPSDWDDDEVVGMLIMGSKQLSDSFHQGKLNNHLEWMKSKGVPVVGIAVDEGVESDLLTKMGFSNAVFYNEREHESMKPCRVTYNTKDDAVWKAVMRKVYAFFALQLRPTDYVPQPAPVIEEKRSWLPWPFKQLLQG